MANWDVIVIGLGGVGSAAAYHLARAGHRVLGLDQYEPVHAYGSSHGLTRIIRQAYFEHPSYVPLLQRAYELWDDLEQASGQRLFHRTGLVEIGPADGIVIPGVLRSAAEHQLDIESLTIDEVGRRWPGLAGPGLLDSQPGPSGAKLQTDWRAVIEHNAGYLRVEACVETHLQLAQQHSATLKFRQRVRRWTIDGDGVTVSTDEGVQRAAHLVVACGAWSQPMLGKLGMPLRVLRKHLYWYQPQQTGCTEREGFPCFFHETPAGYFYGFPATDGAGDSAGVKVARHSGGTEIDAPTPTHPSDPADQALVEDYLRDFLPGVGTDLIDQQGCYYTVTPDEHFILDRHPEQDQVTIVAGLSGHGFKFTSVLGELAGKLASGEPTMLDTSLLRIDR